MSNLKGCFSSASDNWRTPSRIYAVFMRAGFVDCFPFMSEEDELAKSYKNQKLYINPPYSQISRGGGVKMSDREPDFEANRRELNEKVQLDLITRIRIVILLFDILNKGYQKKQYKTVKLRKGVLK